MIKYFTTPLADLETGVHLRRGAYYNEKLCIQSSFRGYSPEFNESLPPDRIPTGNVPDGVSPFSSKTLSLSSLELCNEKMKYKIYIVMTANSLVFIKKKRITTI